MRIQRLLNNQLPAAAAVSASITTAPFSSSTSLSKSISSKHLRKRKRNLQQMTSSHSRIISSRQLQKHVSHKLTTTTAPDATTATSAASLSLPRSGYVVELSEKELHALIDGSNWRLSSFCIAVDYVYNDRSSQGFNIKNSKYVSYVDQIN